MKAVVQRVQEASVEIEGKIHSSIGHGMLILLGIHNEDTEDDAAWIARKIAGMRIFEDSDGLMNEALSQCDGELLVISQFTLIASVKKGNRPSFNDAAPPKIGESLYRKTVAKLEDLTNKPVKTGVFAANMKVRLLNDGPVTIILDTRFKE